MKENKERNMKKLITLCIVLMLVSCEKTTNGMIYTQYSNIPTYVYITEYGNSYHVRDCPTIIHSNTTYIKREEAEARGYTTCLVCFY